MDNVQSFVQFPDLDALENTFNRISGFRTYGVIDGTHVRVILSHRSFINRYGYPSVVLLGIVGPALQFLHIHCGSPGSVSDPGVLRQTAFTPEPR